MKTRKSLIDFDVHFPMHSSEFTKSVNFGSNLKKIQQKILFFSPKVDFMNKNIFFQVENMDDSDRSESDLSDETIRI